MNAAAAVESIALREEASKRARANAVLGDTSALSAEQTQALVHELQVHQIELQMQNEELQRAQAEIDTARLRYFDLYDNAPVGYCTLDAAARIQEVNLTAATLLGVVRGEMVGQTIQSFIAPEDQDIYYFHRRSVPTTGASACELHMQVKGRAAVWVQLVSTQALAADGAVMHRIVLNDITARREVQDKLQHTTLLAEKASAAKSDFLSCMSHELRTPLNAILGFAQLLDTDDGSLSNQQKRQTGQILLAGWYLLDLINEILDLTLIESGRLVLKLEPVLVADLLLECHTLVKPQAEKGRIRIALAPVAPPGLVMADRMRLKQVLLNLLSNAIKYNHSGGSVDVTARVLANGRMRLEVSDTGAGLPPDQLALLFQPFNRLGQEHSGIEGTGIGLVVARQLAQAMGGDIAVHSTPGQGCTFWVELPSAGA